MKPPIPAPWGDKKIARSERVEWDDERGCFVLLRGVTSFWAMMRCELFIAPRDKRVLLLWLFIWPLMLLIGLWLAAQERFKAPGTNPDEFLIFNWGFQTAASGTTFETKWDDITRIFIRRGDVFIARTAAHLGDSYLCRECLAGEAETTRLVSILGSLRAANGANWEEVVRQFRT